jgi:hypothetical protein
MNSSDILISKKRTNFKIYYIYLMFQPNILLFLLKLLLHPNLLLLNMILPPKLIQYVEQILLWIKNNNFQKVFYFYESYYFDQTIWFSFIRLLIF